MTGHRTTMLQRAVPRMQLIELHEQPFCPPLLREGVQDVLALLWCFQLPYILPSAASRVAPRLAALLRASKKASVVDLCSGGGGPILDVMRALSCEHGQHISATVTDLYPNRDAYVETSRKSLRQVKHVLAPVDATRVPSVLVGARTIFAAFHHFDDGLARSILEDAVAKGEPIAVFEYTERSFMAIFFTIWACLVGTFWLAPLHANFTLRRAFWTYVIPAIPALMVIDGIVSCLRTRSEAELHNLVGLVERSEQFVWEFGTAPGTLPGMRMPFLTGRPKDAE